MSLAAEGIAGLWAFLALLLAGFVISIIRAPSWSGTAPADSATLADLEFDAPAPEQVRHDHAPRHAPGHAPAHAQDVVVPLPGPARRAYTPRHIPVQPSSQDATRPRVSGSPPWGPAPRPPDYLAPGG